MSMPTLRVAVGSTNPVKVASVKAAFAKSFGAAVVTSSHDVASGVSDQPYGDLETRTDALERAAAALRADADADYAVGLEGGVVDAAQGGLESVAWMAVTRRSDGRRNVARTRVVPAASARPGLAVSDSRPGSRSRRAILGAIAREPVAAVTPRFRGARRAR